MSTVFSILALLCNLATLVFFILVLIKMFQKAGALQGILGLICGLWAFIWGWMNLKDEKFQNLPLMWAGRAPLFSASSSSFSAACLPATNSLTTTK